MAQGRGRGGRAAEGSSGGRLRGVGRRQCRAPEGAARRACGSATISTPSRAACVCGAHGRMACSARRHAPARQRPDGPPRRVRPACRRPGRAAPRRWSAARSVRRGCGSRSAAASSTRSITRASTFRRSAISASSSPMGRASGSEVKRLYRHTLTLAAPGVPAVRIVHQHERFELRAARSRPTRERDVLLIEVELTGDDDAASLRAARAASRRHRQRQLGRRRRPSRPPRAVGRAGAVRAGARRGDARAARCLGTRQRRLRRRRATAGRISRATAR